MELYPFRIEAPISLFSSILHYYYRKPKSIETKKPRYEIDLKYSAIISFACDKPESLIFVF